MNLHGIVSGAIGVINPPIALNVRVSTGSANDASFKPVPTYAAAVTVQGQVQPIQFRDIQQLDALNLQGTRRRIYLYDRIDGLVRVSNKGGDLITDPDGNIWLVAFVAEQWPDWVACVVTLQNGA